VGVGEVGVAAAPCLVVGELFLPWPWVCTRLLVAVGILSYYCIFSFALPGSVQYGGVSGRTMAGKICEDRTTAERGGKEWIRPRSADYQLPCCGVKQ
jgi:hypothetical protein